MIDGTITIKTRDFEPDTCVIEWKGNDGSYYSKTGLEAKISEDLTELINLILDKRSNYEKLLNYTYAPF
jgi:hypothetical protein